MASVNPIPLFRPEGPVRATAIEPAKATHSEFNISVYIEIEPRPISLKYMTSLYSDGVMSLIDTSSNNNLHTYL